MRDSRDAHTRIREIVCTVRDDTGFYLLVCRFAVVLDVSVFECGVESFEIEERGDVWVCCGAVVAFVEVVCEDFPIEMAWSGCECGNIGQRQPCLET
jgi:hypothetical protein